MIDEIMNTDPMDDDTLAGDAPTGTDSDDEDESEEVMA
jgi:hypothetical protein